MIVFAAFPNPPNHNHESLVSLYRKVLRILSCNDRDRDKHGYVWFWKFPNIEELKRYLQRESRTLIAKSIKLRGDKLLSLEILKCLKMH